MQVFIVAADLGECAQLEREQVGLARVPEASAIPDHRIRLVGLVRRSAGKVPEFVRPEVHRPIDDGPRRERSREDRRLSAIRCTNLRRCAAQGTRGERAGIRGQQAPADGDALHGGEVETAPIVLTFEYDLPSATEHFDAHAAGAGLTERPPLGCRLCSRRHRITYNLRERALHGREDVKIQAYVAA